MLASAHPTLFDYVTTSAIAASAFATALLAYFTWRMAKKTGTLAESAEREAGAVERQGVAVQAQADAVRAQADAAADQVLVTTQAFQASIRPWLTIGEDREGVGDHFRSWVLAVQVSDLPPSNLIQVSLTVRNVGAGLAFIDAEASEVWGWGALDNPSEPTKFVHGRIKNALLPPGEEATLEFSVAYVSAAWTVDLETFAHQKIGGFKATDGELYLDIVYSDATGGQRTRARFHVTGNSNGWWSTAGIDYFTPPDAERPAPSVRF